MEHRDLQLPVLVVRPGDLGRLVRELAAIDEQLLQLKLRQAGSEVKLPKTSQLMDQLITLNGLNLLQVGDRDWLMEALDAIKNHAPILNISFSVDPSPVFMGRLMTWLRQEIHPFVLVNIGLQPNIAAGCMVRTTNQVFDFTLRRHFAEKRDMLKQALIAGPAAPPAPEAAQ